MHRGVAACGAHRVPVKDDPLVVPEHLRQYPGRCDQRLERVDERVPMQRAGQEGELAPVGSDIENDIRIDMA